MAQTLQPQYDTVTVINKEYAYGKYQTTIGSAALLQRRTERGEKIPQEMEYLTFVRSDHRISSLHS